MGKVTGEDCLHQKGAKAGSAKDHFDKDQTFEEKRQFQSKDSDDRYRSMRCDVVFADGSFGNAASSEGGQEWLATRLKNAGAYNPRERCCDAKSKGERRKDGVSRRACPQGQEAMRV